MEYTKKVRNRNKLVKKGNLYPLGDNAVGKWNKFIKKIDLLSYLIPYQLGKADFSNTKQRGKSATFLLEGGSSSYQLQVKLASEQTFNFDN